LWCRHQHRHGQQPEEERQKNQGKKKENPKRRAERERSPKKKIREARKDTGRRIKEILRARLHRARTAKGVRPRMEILERSPDKESRGGKSRKRVRAKRRIRIR
jgi:hypothetical protein